MITRLYQSAIKAKTKKIILIENAEHSLIKWLNNQPKHLKLVAEKVVELIGQ